MNHPDVSNHLRKAPNTDRKQRQTCKMFHHFIQHWDILNEEIKTDGSS